MEQVTKLLVLTILAASIGGCTCWKILCLMPIPGRSHTMVVQSVCTELAERNHDVTAVTAFPIKDAPPNYKQISVEDLVEMLMKRKEEFDVFSMRTVPMSLMVPVLYNMGLEFDEGFLSHPKVVELIHSNEKFDLIFTESFLAESVYSGFMSKFNIPSVIIAPFMPNLWVNNMVGNPAPYSYIPDPFLGFNTNMTFIERVANVVFGVVNNFLYHCWYLPNQDSLMRKHFGQDLPPLKDTVRNVSLVLVNHHYSLAYARPYVPNMIEVAGLHVPKVKKLPENLQTFLDEAKEGVIYFSLGSNIESNKMPKEKLQIFLDVFSRLKLKVLWKWESDDLPQKLDNVKTSKWFPQSDILAHPNLKLFITHGGLGSIIETVYRGVPIVGVPIFAEQPLNMKHAVLAGIGKMVDFDDMTADQLYDAIQEVLSDPRYLENVRYRSKLMKDTPMNASDTAMYWIDYVIRHDGARHLRSASLDLKWYQLYLIDVLLVIGAVLLISTLTTVYFFKLCSRICRKKQPQKTKKTTKSKKDN